MVESDRVDVAVVGAGYAGLAAALGLREQGRDVVVLEAASRVGGRVWSGREGGLVLDHGGQWVGPTQTRLHAWADRFGCDRFRSYDVGDHVEIWADGRQSRFETATAPDAPGVIEYAAAADRLDAMAATVPVEQPWLCSSLVEWDGETVESWLRRTVASEAARRRMALAVRGVWSCEPRDLSVFHLVFYIAAAGGFGQLMDTLGAAQDSRFVDGAQTPAIAVARHLGDAIRLGVRVVDVREEAGVVRVLSDAGEVVADRVVVAVPPVACGKIRFVPGLPVARRRWLARSPMGDVAKVHVRYAKPFWRDGGLSGQVVSLDRRPVSVVFDNSPVDASCGVLVAFVYGDRYRGWASGSSATRRSQVLDTLVDVFGERAGRPVGYSEQLWPDDCWAEGGYAAVPVPGTWAEHAKDGWRTPCGRVHWAGTETADVWHGYIEGAIRSGERAAREVQARFVRGDRGDSNDSGEARGVAFGSSLEAMTCARVQEVGDAAPEC